MRLKLLRVSAIACFLAAIALIGVVYSSERLPTHAEVWLFRAIIVTVGWSIAGLLLSTCAFHRAENDGSLSFKLNTVGGWMGFLYAVFAPVVAASFDIVTM
jgi:hypothetical protein